MAQDIRDKQRLNHKDIVRLNFVRDPGIYVYRRHYRAGLRSHIMELLSPEQVEQEKKGVIRDGFKWFPPAKPLKMLRIFRTKFNSLKEAKIELKRVKIIEEYLSPDHLARSDEFLVDYTNNGQRKILLCGLQEYVEGEILNPWGPLHKEHLVSLLGRMSSENGLPFSLIAEQWMQGLQKSAKSFIKTLKKIIIEKYHVPDLAGVGNLLVTRSGDIKLVDINNISRVTLEKAISLDDRGYPVCDKSIEALFLLEKGLTGKCIGNDYHIFEIFLEPERMRHVKAVETKFYSCWKRNSLSPLR
jgi:hypothetical protein